ncbi:MAG: hypothetical protein AAB921_02240 [Patescibacteria group bacterium]
MSSNVKTVIGVVSLIVVAAALYFGIQWYEGKYGEGSAVFSTEPVVLPSGESTTDDSLAEDAAAIDAELKALDADNASAEASIEESAQVQ